MKPDFALSLSLDGITLLHRAPPGWETVGDEVALDSRDLAGDLSALKAAGARMSGAPLRCKLVLPRDQIRFMDVPLTGLSDAERQAQVAAALEGSTPYDLEELAYDFTVRGAVAQVAAVARETLKEAEAFAAKHGFDPVCFVAIPETREFRGEPFFGMTSAASALLAPGEAVERDHLPIRITGHAPAPALDATPDTDREGPAGDDDAAALPSTSAASGPVPPALVPGDPVPSGRAVPDPAGSELSGADPSAQDPAARVSDGRGLAGRNAAAPRPASPATADIRHASEAESAAEDSARDALPPAAVPAGPPSDEGRAHAPAATGPLAGGWTVLTQIATQPDAQGPRATFGVLSAPLHVVPAGSPRENSAPVKDSAGSPDGVFDVDSDVDASRVARPPATDGQPAGAPQTARGDLAQPGDVQTDPAGAASSGSAPSGSALSDPATQDADALATDPQGEPGAVAQRLAEVAAANPVFRHTDGGAAGEASGRASGAGRTEDPTRTGVAAGTIRLPDEPAPDRDLLNPAAAASMASLRDAQPRDEDAPRSGSAFFSRRGRRKTRVEPAAPRKSSAQGGTAGVAVAGASRSAGGTNAPQVQPSTQSSPSAPADPAPMTQTGSGPMAGQVVASGAGSNAGALSGSGAGSAPGSAFGARVAAPGGTSGVLPGNARMNAVTEADRMTVFGARAAQGLARPRHVALLLIALIGLFVAGGAGWSTIFRDPAVAGLLEQSNSDVETAEARIARSTDGPVAPTAELDGDESQPSPDPRPGDTAQSPDPRARPDASLAATPDASTGAEVAAQALRASETAAEAGDPSPRADSAAPALSDPAGPDADTPPGPVAAVSPAPDAADPNRPAAGSRDPAATAQAVSDRGAARYAATGIWSKAPTAVPTPSAGDLGDLYLAAVDSSLGVVDPETLTQPDRRRLDRVPERFAVPAPPKTEFDLDDRGMVRARPGGAVSPDGVTVYAGRPVKVPPARPARTLQAERGPEPPQVAPDATAAEKAAVQRALEETLVLRVDDLADPALSRTRPRARPDTVQAADAPAAEVAAADPAGTAAEAAVRAGPLADPRLAAKRPRLRPVPALRPQPEIPPGGTNLAALPGVRSALAEAADDSEETEAATDESSVDVAGIASSVRPSRRPADLDPPAAARSTRAVAAVAPRRAVAVQPSIPSRTSVTRQATVQDAINLSRINLIGVYGRPASRRALVRLSDGRYQKVKIGDSLDGGRVAAIGDAELRYVKGGRNHVLELPGS